MVTHKLPRGTIESDLEAGIAPRASGEASATVTEHRYGGSHHQGGQGSPCRDPTPAATGLRLSLHPTLHLHRVCQCLFPVRTLCLHLIDGHEITQLH